MTAQGKKWKNRHGKTVEVLLAEEESLDVGGLKWVAVCTGHGTLVGATSKADAEKSCRDTTQFCDQCREEAVS